MLRTGCWNSDKMWKNILWMNIFAMSRLVSPFPAQYQFDVNGHIVRGSFR